MELQPPDEEALTCVLVADLADRFPSIARARIEEIVRPIVAEWFAHARVKSFVGIIAERRARNELRRVVESEASLDSRNAN